MVHQETIYTELFVGGSGHVWPAKGTTRVGRGTCNNSLERKQLDSLRAPINSGSGQGRKASQDSQLPTPYPTPPTPVMTRLIKNPHLPRSFSLLFFFKCEKKKDLERKQQNAAQQLSENEKNGHCGGERYG